MILNDHVMSPVNNYEKWLFAVYTPSLIWYKRIPQQLLYKALILTISSSTYVELPKGGGQNKLLIFEEIKCTHSLNRDQSNPDINLIALRKLIADRKELDAS